MDSQRGAASFPSPLRGEGGPQGRMRGSDLPLEPMGRSPERPKEPTIPPNCPHAPGAWIIPRSIWVAMNKTIFAAAAFLAVIAPAQAREVTHAMGTTEVPDNPVRIAILTNEGTEALLHMSVVPVGAAQSWEGDPFYPHLADKLGDAMSLGTETAINLEVLASLEPDLIIGTKVRQEKIYEQLSAIAPTVMSETIGAAWLDNYSFYGSVIGLDDKAAAGIAALEARAGALREEIGDAIHEKISWCGSRQGGRVSIPTTPSPALCLTLWDLLARRCSAARRPLSKSARSAFLKCAAIASSTSRPMPIRRTLSAILTNGSMTHCGLASKRSRPARLSASTNLPGILGVASTQHI